MPTSVRIVGAHRLLKKIFVGLNYHSGQRPFFDELDVLIYTIENRKGLIFLLADDMVTMS